MRPAATRAVAETSAMFQQGFELAATPTALLDADARFVRVNRAFRRLFNAEEPDLVGRLVVDLTHPDDRHLEPEAARAFLSGQDLVEGEKRYVRADGSVIFARYSRVVLAREDGAPTLMMCEVVDQTELRGVLEALRTSQRRLELALEASNDGIYDADFETGEILFSDRMAHMLGYAAHELPKKLDHWMRLVEPSDLARAMAQIEAATDGPGASLDAEVRLRHKDGHWVWVHDRGKIFDRTADGRPRRLIGTLTDITERRALAEQTATQRQLLEGILSNIPVMVAFLRIEGDFEFVNRQFERTIGWTVDEMRGRDMMAEFFPDPDLRAEVIAFIRSGRTGWHDWAMRARDGRELVTAWTNVMLDDGRMVGLGQDVTEQRRAEAERRRLESQLLQAQKLESLGVLAGGIAHDFNNLLVGILGNASLAGEVMAPSDPAAPFVAAMRTAATRAAELTRQLLAYAGKGQFVVEELDLSTLAEEMTGLLKAVVGKHALLRCECDTDLAAIEGDATQLRQVVMSLVTNAAESLGDATGEIVIRTGTIEVDAAFIRSAAGGAELEPGTHAMLEVADGGAGMDEATMARMFEPFFTTKFTGRGLGLAATLGIVRSHRGAIHVRSEPGGGTTVRVALPLARREVTGTHRIPSQAARWSATGDVLLADDEPMVRSVAAMGLARLGFTVVEAADGAEALERFAEDPARWRLVVLDLTMPRLSGDGALRAMRERREDIPAILYSGYTEEALDPGLMSRPGMAFLQKPFSVTALSDAVRQALGEG